MSDEQNKMPKATLIKHRKEETPSAATPEKDNAETKKKVVVVRKKVVVRKAVEDKPAPASSQENRTTAEGSDSAARQNKEDPAAVRKSEPRPSTAGQAGSSEPPKWPRRDSPWQNRGESQGGYRPRPPYNRGTAQDGQSTPPATRQWGDRPPRNDNFNRGPRPPQGAPGDRQDRFPRKDGGYAGGNRGNFSRDSRPPRPAGPGGPGGPGSFRPGGNRPGNFNRPGGGTGYAGRPGGGSFGYNRSGGGTPPAKEAFGDNKKTTVAKKFFKAKKDKEFQKKKQDKERIEEKKLVEYRKKAASLINPVPKEIDIMEVITVADLAKKMNLKASDLIGKLMSLGMMVSINQQIDSDTATILAEEFGCKVNLVSLYDETLIETPEDREEDLQARPPIVTVMGHVDHGKTKLLDAIRQTDVVAGEFGGITQHIGAYMVKTPKGEITFLDTPGHSAFTMMRSRGAQLTDIVVLVVAASEGIMPQTVEAINHAREAKVPIIVAMNKIDLPDSNPEKVMQQLSDHDLMPEEWGGKTQVIKLSALKRTGIEELLDAILLESEMLELRANWDCNAEGKIVESQVDQGRGVVSTILVQRGTLNVGDSFVAGIYSGKVRAMFNDKGQKITTATPSMPVEILGFTGGIPNSGDPFQVTENEKIARQYGMKRQELKKVEEAKNVKKITLANLYDSIQDGDVQELKVIIKGDVHGSVEALESALEKLSTSEIRLTCIHSAAGAIVENDISLASASNAIVIGFHVRPTPKAQVLAEKEKVEIRKYNIIYDAVEDIKTAMEGMLAPEITEEVIGKVEVRDTFKAPKVGIIAGCMVTEGKVTRKSFVNVIRDSVVVFTGRISSLKRFKDDAKEVATGFECGLTIENWSDIKVGDILEIFEKKEVSKKLGAPSANG